MAKMTLSAWVWDTSKEVGRFAQHWIERRKEDPDQFPDIMEVEDWDEQFITWLSQQGKE